MHNTTRGVHFSVRDRTGPRTSSDRTGPVLFGPDFCQIQSSVRSRVGPDQWTEIEQFYLFIFARMEAARSCRVARADRATTLSVAKQKAGP